MNLKLKSYFDNQLKECKTLFDLVWWVIDYGNQKLLFDSMFQGKDWNGNYTKPISFIPFTSNPRFKTICEGTEIKEEHTINYPHLGIWELAGFRQEEDCLIHDKLNIKIKVGNEYIYEIRPCHHCKEKV
jgi:hypothetical protein